MTAPGCWPRRAPCSPARPEINPARLAERLASWLALFGGAVLMAMMGLITVSVTGRALGFLGYSEWLGAAAPALAPWFQGFGQIGGDYELVELAAALAVFAMLPIADITGGHARVELVAPGRKLTWAIDLLWQAVMVAMLGLIAWRLEAGMVSKHGSGGTTFILGLPLWWGYAGALVLASIGAGLSALHLLAQALAGPGRADV